MLDSLVRVSRRVEGNHFLSSHESADQQHMHRALILSNTNSLSFRSLPGHMPRPNRIILMFEASIQTAIGLQCQSRPKSSSPLKLSPTIRTDAELHDSVPTCTHFKKTPKLRITNNSNAPSYAQALDYHASLVFFASLLAISSTI